MKSVNKPRFSVVIPAYNEAHYIADTLDSLQKQNYSEPFEIIVVDNNSTDQTATIASSLGAKVICEKRPGVCWARQAGTEVAQGQIVISGDADTVYSPDWLTKIDWNFRKNDKVIAVTGPCHYVNSPIWCSFYTFVLFGLISFVYQLTRRTYYASATNIAFKKSAWDCYGTHLTQGGDELDLLRKLRKKGLVMFDNSNSTWTSSRRVVRGFVYNFVVTFLIFYILEYNLSRIFKRPILASAPKFRNEFSPKLLMFFHVLLTLVTVALFSLYTSPGRYMVNQAHRLARNSERVIYKRGSQ